MTKLLTFALFGLLLVVVSAQDDAAKRAYVMCIINNGLSSTSCKDTAKAQAGSNDESTACATLQTFQPLLGVVGCTPNDYTLLHQVLCEHIRPNVAGCTLP